MPLYDDALVALYPKHLRPDGSCNTTTLAKEVGATRSTVQSAIERLARAGRLGTKTILPGMGIKSTSEQRDENGDVQKIWIKQAPIGEAFEVPDGHSIKGVSALVDAQGLTIQQWIKTDAGKSEGYREAILAAFEGYRGKAELIPPPEHCDEALLTVYPVSDLHLGMLSWHRETGANYDLSIARDLLTSTLSHLIWAAPKSKTAIILNLGDFLHADDQTNATPASGHQLDVDGRYPKIVREALRLHVAMIEMALAKHELVIVRALPGNHDLHTAQMISVALDLFFEGNPRVTVDADPGDFFWHRHGEVLIGANHGHKVKPENMPGVMAAYRSEDWGATKFRYCYGGHIHHRSKGGGEKFGAVWETFQTLAGKDAYAHSHGYSSGRSLVSITHHATRGEIMRHTVSL